MATEGETVVRIQRVNLQLAHKTLADTYLEMLTSGFILEKTESHKVGAGYIILLMYFKFQNKTK